MRSSKDRLHRVLVIGANPAGLAATNKLGEMGIPVTLVDPDPDLDRKLSKAEWRLDSGVSLNYALRPGLLRILRNPRIRVVIPGEISSLKHTPQGFCAHFESTETFIDADRCVLCGCCADVCPVTLEDGSKPLLYHGRQSLPGKPSIEKRRQPLCQANCPLGVNVQGYVALTRVGRYKEALDLIRRDNILPGICGRICTHPCELACRRGELDAPWPSEISNGSSPIRGEPRDSIRRLKGTPLFAAGRAFPAACSCCSRHWLRTGWTCRGR